MADASGNPRVTGSIPIAHVSDVQRTVDFYRLLGMEVRGSLRNSLGELQWVHVSCEHAHVMFSHGLEPAVAGHHAVLFYMYSPNLIALREHLLTNDVKVSEITYPEYMLRGEICLHDPDGYQLLIGQED